MSDNEDSYTVEKILYRELRGQETFYKIKWEGYTGTTWEPERNLDNCDELLREFKKKMVSEILSEFFLHFCFYILPIIGKSYFRFSHLASFYLTLIFFYSFVVQMFVKSMVVWNICSSTLTICHALLYQR